LKRFFLNVHNKYIVVYRQTNWCYASIDSAELALMVITHRMLL